MTDERDDDTPGTSPGRYGLNPNGPVPDSAPGKHSRPEDVEGPTAAEPPVSDDAPSVHSDVWVAPPSATAPEPGRPQQTPPPQSAHPRPAAPLPPQPTPQPAPRPHSPVAPEPAPAAVSPSPVGPGTNGGSMSEILDTGPTPAMANAPKLKTTGRKSSERKLAYWLIAPAAIVMALVTGYPIVYAFWLSLNKATLTAPDEQEFIGFGNYATVLSDGYWWSAFGVTVFITLVSVAIELVLGMAVALVMHRTLFGRGTIRTVVLIPYGIVTVAAAFSWYYAWTPGTGYLANLLPEGSAPLTEQWPSLFIIILAEVWKTTPFMALLLLAGLALVPDELLKAAQLDGAGAWTRLFRIILPLMKPAILVALLFRTLDAFRIFDNIYVLTAGSNGTGSVSMLGYNNLFKAFNLGVGSAISILIFLCVAIIAFVFIKGFGTAAPGSDDEGR
ncbi:carbohydrate ABC transporter permease [Gordonia hydrophobica]|uniref:Sugar ABC transporter permease n=1 Tax=Gordonia hydrophobica TaxID=40516 RepID=A0ABZ2U1R5_9ACTN|nr:sugar ABC transporter permease [Gordonia hydrophobica]MBM7366623.1 multiple sugar transport system permease protein [Gordonia hydrophobica]